MLNQTKTTETLRLIRCDTASETYGLDMSWVRSIQRTDRLRRSPEAKGPSTSHRGEPVEPSGHSPVGWLPGNEGDIPVFSLASQIGRPSSKEGGALQRIVVLNAEPRPWALLVDRVSQVIQIPADRVVPLPPIVVNPSADYFKGVIKLDKELILLLSPERLHPDAPTPPPCSPPQAEGMRRKAREAVSPSHDLTLSTKSPTTSAGSQRRSYSQIVVFSIAEPHSAERTLSFGLSISQVPEILEPLPLIPVPAAPAFVLGLVNWRDWPVPVIDLAGRLGLASEANPSANGQTRLIIARDKGHVLPIPSSAPGKACPELVLSPSTMLRINPVEGRSRRVEGVVKGSSSKGGANQGALVGFLVRPAVRVLRLPIAHQPCSRTLPLDQDLTRGTVELENETLVIPDIRGILWQEG